MNLREPLTKLVDFAIKSLAPHDAAGISSSLSVLR